ncbi:MAG: glycosyltransferase family 2 protein [Muribaculaceae bacterium]|nr:glycosyltransferase family 2 protein [Muribaculaceae bacterium]
MKPIAVIILNWNGAKLLKEFLPKVVETTDKDLADVIVADNGSTDDSLEIISGGFQAVKTLTFEKNYGYAEGYNRAIDATGYKYTVLLNSDVATADGWLRPLYELMESNPDVGACQPKILSYSEPEKFEYAGACGGFIDRNGYPYCRGRVFSNVETDHGQYDEPMSIFWATGAALMIRTDLYQKVGGLDTSFFAHMEEIDLCWRVLLAGKDIKVEPKSVIYHLGGGSLPASSPRKTYLNFRNNLLLLYKNLPVKSRRTTLIRRRLYDAIAWAKFFVTFDFKNASAILKAHKDFRRMKSNYSTSPEINLLKTRPDCRRNIIVDYYLRRRTTFNKLF